MPGQQHAAPADAARQVGDGRAHGRARGLPLCGAPASGPASAGGCSTFSAAAARSAGSSGAKARGRRMSVSDVMRANPTSRKSRARSSRMCGSGGASPSTPGGSRRGGRKRTKCRPAGAASGFKASCGLAGRSPGNTAASVLPSNTLPPMRSPGIGTPTMHGSHSLPTLASVSRVARNAASACTPTSAPASAGAAHGPIGDDAQDRFQPVVAGGVDVVGLGGGEQQLVDAAHEQRASASWWSRRGTRAGWLRARAAGRRRHRRPRSAARARRPARSAGRGG